MRLIDADNIDFGKVFIGASDFAKDTREAAQKLIDEQPTAYDVDKVLNELREKTELAYKRYMDCPDNTPQSVLVRYSAQYQERGMCLEIVKSGMIE